MGALPGVSALTLMLRAGSVPDELGAESPFV